MQSCTTITKQNNPQNKHNKKQEEKGREGKKKHIFFILYSKLIDRYWLSKKNL